MPGHSTLASVSPSFPNWETSSSCPSALGSVDSKHFSAVGQMQSFVTRGHWKASAGGKATGLLFFPLCWSLWLSVTFEHSVVLTSNKATAWGASRQLFLTASPVLCVVKRTFCYQGPLSFLVHPSQWAGSQLGGSSFSQLLLIPYPLVFSLLLSHQHLSVQTTPEWTQTDG